MELTVDVREQVAWVTLNRPEKANALNGSLWFEIGKTFRELAHDSRVRACVLTGAGKHFCAGIDFSLLAEIGALRQEACPGRQRERLLQKILELQHAFTEIERCPKPVLAAVQGGCVGAGLDLVAACDFVYATPEARFQIKEIDLAIAADIGSLQRLLHTLPQGRVRELAFSAEPFSGAEAERWGLVNRLFEDPEALQAGALARAQQLAQKSPLAMHSTKESLVYSRDHSVSEGLRHIALRNAALLFSEDLDAALDAMTQQHPPQFRD